MKIRKFPIVSVCLTAALVFGSLGGANIKDADAKAKNVKQVKVTNLSGKKLFMVKGASFSLKVKVVAKKKKVSQKVTFKSSSPKIASVSTSGVIKAKKKGTANVTVTSKVDSSKKFQIKVTVTESVLVSKIELSETSLSLDVDDDDYQLTAAVYPSKASKKTVKWSSSDSDVASVSSTGLVTPEAEGEAVITAAATDGSGVIATCTVKVSDSENDDADEEDEENTDPTGDRDTGNTDDRNTGDTDDRSTGDTDDGNTGDTDDGNTDDGNTDDVNTGDTDDTDDGNDAGNDFDDDDSDDSDDAADEDDAGDSDDDLSDED